MPTHPPHRTTGASPLAPRLTATRTAARALALLLTLWIAACATPGPEQAGAAMVAPAALGLSPAPTQAVEASWWQQLGSADLNQLVALALQDHPSVAAARARFIQAGALVAGQGAVSGAQAGLAVDASRQLYTAHGMYPAPIAGHVYNSANVQAGVSWNPDWFGLHAAEEAATLDHALAARADAAVAAQALAAQVSRVYIALARLNAQHQLLTQTQAERGHMLALTRQRQAAGLDSGVELTQAQAPLPDLGQQLEGLAEQMDLARHQLATLTAQPTEALQSLSPQLGSLTLDVVPTALGTDLLGRRPDVVAARWRVEAALQDVKVARAQFYPNVNLGAFVGLNALNLDRLFRSGSVQAGVAPALRLPLFDGGLLRARLQGREAATDAAIAQYNAAVLDAVREASDALTSVQSLQRQREAQQTTQAHLAHAHALALQRQRAGLTGRMPVLQAHLQQLQQQRTAVELQARDLDSRVLLMKALGGGWSEEPATLTPAAAAPSTPATSTTAAHSSQSATSITSAIAAPPAS